MSKGDKKLWTQAEDDIIREVYPAGGPKAVLKILGDRTIGAIYRRAFDLHLTSTYKPRRPRPIPDEARVHPLVRELLKRIAAAGISRTDLCMTAGVGMSAVGNLYTSTPRIENLEAMANVVGLTLRLVEMDP